ncbi:MAG: hypothetical protein ACOX0P_02990 [Candidatus Dojkabacteria bacterium]
MAQQRRQYEGAMESIFDFIFEQNERPPHKRTPLKVTGVDGTSEVVEALGAVLEKPGAFVNDATMDGLIEFANIDLAKINLGDRLPGVVKFNLKDIGTILKDPSAYVEKSFKTMEAIRRSQRIAHSGEIMGSLVAKGWAKRHGLGKEVGDAMMNIGRPQAFRGKMNVRALKLMEEYFKEEAAKKDTLGIRKSSPKTIGLAYLTDRYGKGKAEMLYGKYKGVKEVWENWKKAEGKGDLEAAKRHRDSLLSLMQDSKFPEFYAMLESREIRRLITGVTDREEKLNYVRAARYIDNMAVIQGNPFLEKQKRTLFIENTKQTIESREKIIEQLKQSGAPTSEIAKHRQAIKDLKSDLRDIKNYEFAGRLGEWEGMYYSAKTMFTEGNLLPFMINGKFFDPNHNQIKWLQPAAKGKMYIGKDKKGGKLGELEFVAPKKTGNRYSDNYNAGMTSLYYFSPVTWAKTLYTGEGFAYMAYLSQEKMSKILLKEITKDLPFEVGDFFEAIANGDVDLFMADLQNIMSTEAFEKIERLTSKLGKQYKLAHRFSAYSRFKANIQKNFDEKIGKNLREFVGNKILLKLGFVLKDEIAKVAVEAWMESGGLYGMIRTVITAGLNAIGIPGLVADALAWLATKVVVKIAKPVVKFGAEFLKYGLVGCFGMALFIVVIIGSAIFGVHSHIAPGTCEDCEEWATYAEEYKYGSGEYECYACDGEAFKAIEGIPSYDSVPSIAKDYFATYIRPKITEELMKVYKETEETTGIPCEIIAGIHYMEGGMRLDGSLHDGGSLRGGNLLSDAISAMEHLKSKIPSGSASGLNYKTLINALGDYNGPGNRNCSYTPPPTEVLRQTRWRTSGKCTEKQTDEYYFDHIYPLNWINEDYMDMDLIYCRDGVEFSCNTFPSSSVPVGQEVCYQGAGTVCNPGDTDNNSRKYPLFQRPGVITVAIMMHEYSITECRGGGRRGSGGGTEDLLACLSRPPYTGEKGLNPYASEITSIANLIVGYLDKGHWGYHNKPRENMPDEYEYGSGGRKWKQELFDNPQTRGNNAILQADAYSLYWCTWLTKDSYVGAGVPESSTVFSTLAVRLQAAEFAKGANGYDFVCNGPNVVNGISAGDVIFFYDNSFTHVGIVSSVSSSYIGSLESNSGSTSYKYTVADDGSISNPYIFGFGRYR